MTKPQLQQTVNFVCHNFAILSQNFNFFSYTSYFLLFNFLLCKALRITIVYEMCYKNKLALPYNDLVSKLWLCISLLIYQMYYDLSKHDYSYILIGSSIIQK